MPKVLSAQTFAKEVTDVTNDNHEKVAAVELEGRDEGCFVLMAWVVKSAVRMAREEAVGVIIAVAELFVLCCHRGNDPNSLAKRRPGELQADKGKARFPAIRGAAH